MNSIEIFGKRWKELSDDERIEYRRLSYLERQDQIREKMRLNRLANPLKTLEANRKYYKANRQKLIDNLRKRRFSLSHDKFVEIMNAGCYAPGCEDRTRLVIDHDHSCCPLGMSCGKCVRGALCNRHNVHLGYLEKDPEFAQWALDNVVRRMAK